jgi:Putative transposase
LPVENGRVSFEWKDYAHHGQRKIMTLDALEFIRRFLLHVLPSGLVRIRQFGFLANRFRTRNLQLCRDLLAVRQIPAPADSHKPANTNIQDYSSCPICKLGQLIRIEVIHPQWSPDTS